MILHQLPPAFMAPLPPQAVPLPRAARGRLGLHRCVAVRRNFPHAAGGLDNGILASPVATGEVARHRRDDRGACSIISASHDGSTLICHGAPSTASGPPPPCRTGEAGVRAPAAPSQGYRPQRADRSSSAQRRPPSRHHGTPRSRAFAWRLPRPSRPSHHGRSTRGESHPRH